MKALEAAGRLTTRELAAQLGADRNAVYKCCKRLEKDGRLTSELIKAAKRDAFFFPMTMEAVTSQSHDRIERLDEAVRETVRAYSLPQEKAQLIDALEAQFERLSENMAADSRSAIEEFAEELIEAVSTATKQGDVTSHLGIRPRHPAARVWALGGQLSLT
ncbi:MAG TPA: winged helix-turn-helix domain-containing protein [Solirubrobacterales bacterium]|nr:winged helix-turn-helix domain-containing protein [Solirubrobacterales bacterium]